MDVNSGYDTPGSETKDNLLLIAMAVTEYQHFDISSSSHSSHSEEVWKMSVNTVSCFTGREPGA